jgi:hypothetical protein
MLPDLSENIKCGNSLIGSDFYETSQMSLFQDEETTRRINVFDWHKEFPDIFTQGGFDIVIGNPPYVKYENLNKEESFYYKKTYKTAIKFFDIFSLFLEKSFYLCSKDGVFSFIFPNLFLKGMNYIESRKFFLENTWMSIINDYSDGVFENVQMPTCVIVFHKKITKNYKVIFYSKNVKIRTIDQDTILKTDNKIISPGNLEFSNEKKYFKLGNIAFIRRGLEIGRDKSDVDGKIETLFGADIERYFIKGIHTITEETYETYKKKEKIFLGEKLIIRETGSKLIIVYDKENMLLNRSLYVIKSNDVNLLYLLGILNSKLMQKYYEENYKSNTEIFPKIRIGQVRELPVRKINFENKKETELHDKMVEVVVQMLEVQKKYHNAKTENEKTIFKKQIDILDNQIDKLVYKLYELTDEEIKIVEGEE